MADGHEGAERDQDAPSPEKQPSRIEQAQELQRRLKSSAAGAGERLRQRRAYDSRVDYALSVFERDRATGGLVLAGAVAFRLFLFFVPFVVLIVLVLGIGSGTSSSAQDLARRIGIGGLVARAAGGTNHMSTWERITSLIIVGYALFWGARALYKVLYIVFSLEWSLPITRIKATKPGLVVIGFAALCLGAELGLSRLREISSIGGPFATVFFFFLPAAFWLLALQHLPHHPDSSWWLQLPGAFVVTLGVEAVHLVTIYWVANQISRKSALYGGIGSALAILFWAYLMGRVIVFSGVVNSLLWERRKALRAEANPSATEPGR